MPESLLARVSEVSDGSAAVSVLLIGAILVLVVHSLIWMAYVCVRYESREWIARMFDSESYPSGPFYEAFGEAIRTRLTSPVEPWCKTEIRLGCRPAITSPTGTYQLGKLLGCGDLCDVHYATSGDETFALKIPRVSGCGRLLSKEQMILRKFQDNSQGDLYGKYFPVPAESFWSDRRLVSAMKWREGFFTAEEVRQRYPAGIDSRHLAWMFNRTLEALGFVHSMGWVHGGVLPPHLLFHTADHGMQLIGWIHATPLNTPLQVVSRKFKSWYPPECQRREAATPATDICLAAKTIIWLAGGDPLDDQLPDHLPIEFGCFLEQCLTPSPSHRVDAWSVHEQFRELLEDLYGPPKFCHLNMA